MVYAAISAISPGRIIIHRHGKTTDRSVPNYGTDIAALMDRSGARLGWAQRQDDGDEILYFYDGDEDGFGNALNLDREWCSEWGYSPFGIHAAD
jgi:hypothetical protein